MEKNLLPVCSDNALTGAIRQLTKLNISCNCHNLSLVMKRVIEKEGPKNDLIPNFDEDIKEWFIMQLEIIFCLIPQYAKT
jgi:hypothetical protein